MAAIAEISTLREWDEEWRTVEDDLLKFKVSEVRDPRHLNSA